MYINLLNKNELNMLIYRYRYVAKSQPTRKSAPNQKADLQKNRATAIQYLLYVLLSSFWVLFRSVLAMTETIQLTISASGHERHLRMMNMSAQVIAACMPTHALRAVSSPHKTDVAECPVRRSPVSSRKSCASADTAAHMAVRIGGSGLNCISPAIARAASSMKPVDMMQ